MKAKGPTKAPKKAPKPKVGRPTKSELRGFAPRVADKVVEGLECGLSREQAASYAGILHSRFAGWLEQGREGVRPYADFLIRVLEAEAAAVVGPLQFLSEVLKCDSPNNLKLAVDVAKFLVDRADRREQRTVNLRISAGGGPLEQYQPARPTTPPIIIDAESYTVEQAREILLIEQRDPNDLAKLLADDKE